MKFVNAIKIRCLLFGAGASLFETNLEDRLFSKRKNGAVFDALHVHASYFASMKKHGMIIVILRILLFFLPPFRSCLVIGLYLSNITIISQERFKYSVHNIPERETFDQVS